MKKLLLASLVVASLGLASSATAQTAGPVGGPPTSPVIPKAKARLGKKEMAIINEEVMVKMNLTEDQKTKIKAHEDAMAAQELPLKQRVKAARKAGTVDADATEKLKAMRKDDKGFMKQVLTKEQMKEMVKLRRDAIKDYEAKNGVTPAPTKP